jgi:hypothetical protein
MNSFSALDSNYRRGRCLSHIDTEGEFGVPGYLLLEFLEFCANSGTAKIRRKKFQAAAFADVVIKQAQEGIRIEHLALRFVRYCERWSDPTQRNSRFRSLSWFLDDGECVALSLSDLALWVRNILNGRKEWGNVSHACKMPVCARESRA